jgi:tetratricopeptide (TPR) repeat protein
VARLLDRVRHVVSDAELFAGLVQACRYCGLLDASVAAYERAHRLDPGVATSVAQTFVLQGEWERAMAVDRSDPPFTTAHALIRLGRGAEALKLLNERIARGLQPQLENLARSMIAALEGRHDDVIRHTHLVIDSGIGDQEVLYHWGSALAEAGDHDGALGLLERAIEGGFHPASALMSDPRFDSMRAMADFRKIVRRADELQHEAFETFRAADGSRLLGLPHV